jgi:hypothetical protein
MQKIFSRLGYTGPGLIGGSLLVYAAANLLVYFAHCEYDDLYNVWSCKEAWAIAWVENLDPVIIFIVYPVFFIGALLAAYRLILTRQK